MLKKWQWNILKNYLLLLLHPEKARRLDVMTAFFFQHFWHLIKEDLVEMVNNFLVSGLMDSRLNIINICVIPKMERPTKMTKLQPISLCNVQYKIISKVLCQRLKTCLPSFMSETQSAFVARRLISYNILIAHEIFHGWQTSTACQGKYMAIKTDIDITQITLRSNFYSLK